MEPITQEDKLAKQGALSLEELKEILLEALPIIAILTGGYAALTDSQGRRLRVVDSKGQEVEELRGKIFPLAAAVANSRRPGAGRSEIVEDVNVWAVPLGDYVLVCSNIDRIRRERSLHQALEAALPLIARMVGGNCSLFDGGGRIVASYAHDGTANRSSIGETSLERVHCLHRNMPAIVEGPNVEGKMVLRIPVSEEIGIEIDNSYRILEQRRLREQKFNVDSRGKAKYTFDDLVGKNWRFVETINLARYVAEVDSAVLISGETGTGKELFAHAIHNYSVRRDMPFIAINCGALPSSLVESILFGYEGGAFTGASKQGEVGLFEQANHGTLFLDEISAMPLDLQSRLLRVLQEKEVWRLGGKRPIPVNVRVISATNCDIPTLISEGKFRQDLYYRLNVFEIHIPPLRERKDDLYLLIDYFLEMSSQTLGKQKPQLHEKTYSILAGYSWPGNVRELKNCIERAVAMVPNGGLILPEHLPEYLSGFLGKQEVSALRNIKISSELNIIREALTTSKSRKEAAQKLGISTTTLWRKMKLMNNVIPVQKP
ncbi:RNA polymerase sigma factor 54 interaction domain [Moorella glycerini]|uniref:Limonene hydroxylase n=1 Tax=Neomoorella stamsii TaxID=1266720 RepID=A0A9X7J5T2_9FIRM|nr:MULTISPECIES: sigma 54-interacting transcriptional regulator [Moorella]PRR77105.1 Limonene hydroxylase [Moorella stamsii]CEP66854.1 RNA polymerase sigma factor 54 interaction domain [Moorella glycerini]